jgi:hypothetical protein
MNTWSYYNLSTGLFTGQTFSGSSPQIVNDNAPAGCGRMQGMFDPLSRRVDLSDPENPTVVDYQPPAPVDDEWQTWAWDDETRRWRSVPTLAALKRSRIAPLQNAMAAIDRMRIRPATEIALAMAAGQPAPEAALERLEETEAELVALRAVHAAIEAAADQAELDATTWP